MLLGWWNQLLYDVLPDDVAVERSWSQILMDCKIVDYEHEKDSAKPNSTQI